ncbi:phage head morphogenesis protein, partial [Acinetobacter baumannii]
TKDMIRDTVGQALKEGWSPQKLGKAIRASAGFSATRADTIARTELAIADVQGTLAGWKESGLVAGKKWLTAPGCCDACHQI